MSGRLADPIIVTGAGRSGTKLLRAILAQAPETVAFPREINYLWRHGNVSFPTDELRPEHARPDVSAYIRGRFARWSRRNQTLRVVEKTCANSLRLGFVRAIFPTASLIHLIRDGRAVAESARRRWLARPDLPYLLEKLRWVPARDIPYYGLRYMRYQLGRVRGQAIGAPSSWGPRFAGLDQLMTEKELIQVCGIQWRTCVRAADDYLQSIPDSPGHTLRYEDLVADPLVVTAQLFAVLNLTFDESCARFVQATVTQDNLVKWRKRLSIDDLALLLPHV
ncbi:MAG: sulfotransferase, partial [Candidatus Promineifilaceae bacterium]|nr:sulfotransferase [Candidatus Promineifilaceae bacterium]